MPEFLIFPYLPGRNVLAVADWQLIPFVHLREHCPDEETFKLASGLHSLYHPAGDITMPMGVFARRGESMVGDTIDRSAMKALRLAVLTAQLDTNPSRTTGDEEDDDAIGLGGSAVTSDNAAMWGHPVKADGWTVADYGELVRTLAGGLNVNKADSAPIHPPIELPRPWAPAELDEEYATALHGLLSAGDSLARRLTRAIEWLDVAWRNSPSVTLDVRITALRAGFEILFGTDRVEDLRYGLSALLEPDGAATAPRTWTTLKGNERTEEMTDLGWWLTTFSFLRNAIMHGDDVPAADYDWEGVNHFWWGEERLRQAIKQLVINAGHPDLLLEPHARLLRRLIQEHGLAAPDEGEDEA